ncbi:MAG TPA: fumarylacetoacetase [Bryobacteraceae bacterium]|nr:fumarylacetoacetase [Bryobacteraceae bacterium]
MIDHTHDPSLQSWVESANEPGADFPIQNLPYGTFRLPGEDRQRVGIAIGDAVLDATEALGVSSVHALMSLPPPERAAVRQTASTYLANYCPGADRALHPTAEVDLLLPVEIPDYTDFYASIDHATNVGRLFRPDNPLPPNYKWMPIAYHGRASSIVVSGTPIHRPRGQILSNPAGPPEFAPTRMLDYEVELGAFLAPPHQIFGVCLLNDWSARDIQSWEYQPLGPFLSKNFATSISPWIVTLEALEPFRCAPPPRDPQPLPHLAAPPNSAFRITLEAWLRTPLMSEPVRLSRGDFSTMYWTLAQMVAHHTSNGCPLRAGDLIGSGTVSGPEKENRGCLLELTSRGAEPIQLPNGETRRFLEDGDELILRGFCEAPGFRRIGLGECRGAILPNRDREEAPPLPPTFV